VTLPAWKDFKEPLSLRQSWILLLFIWLQEIRSKPKFSNRTAAKTSKLCEKNMGMWGGFLSKIG